METRTRQFKGVQAPEGEVAVERLTRAAKALWDEHRDPHCVLCPLHENARTVCMFGNGPVPAAGMIVGEGPGDIEDELMRAFQGTAGQYLDAVLYDVELERSDLYITNATRCRPPREDKDELLKVAKKACAPYLETELSAVQPKAVLAVGGIAYYFFKKQLGILKARGQAFFSEPWQCWVVPTVHPRFVLENPAYHEMFTSDMLKFKRLMSGITDAPPVDIVEIHTLDDWRAALAELDVELGRPLTFDFETRGFNDHDPEKFQAWCVAITHGVSNGAGPRVFMLPLEHPDSPFLEFSPPDDWPGPELWPPDPPLRIAPRFQGIVGDLVGLLHKHRVIGHSVKFDARQLARLAERYGRTL